MQEFRSRVGQFFNSSAGAATVEYAVALIVITIVGAVIFQFGGNIAAIIDLSAGSF